MPGTGCQRRLHGGKVPTEERRSCTQASLPCFKQDLSKGIQGRIGFASSEDMLFDFDGDTYSAHHLKHPSPHPSIKCFSPPTTTPIFVKVSAGDAINAVLSFPIGLLLTQPSLTTTHEGSAGVYTGEVSGGSDKLPFSVVAIKFLHSLYSRRTLSIYTALKETIDYH